MSAWAAAVSAWMQVIPFTPAPSFQERRVQSSWSSGKRLELPKRRRGGRSTPEAVSGLFQWLQQAGIDEGWFRQTQYMTAVTKCYPGKARNGSGDRVPSQA